MEMGGRDEVLPLAAELLAIDSCCRRGVPICRLYGNCFKTSFGIGDSVELFEHLLKASVKHEWIKASDLSPSQALTILTELQ